MRAIMIAPVALILCLTISVQLEAGLIGGGHKGDDLKALCEGKDIDLTSVTQFKALFNKVYDTDEGVDCKAEIINGLHALNDVVLAGDDKACSLEKASAIRKFAERFFQHGETLPKTLARFAKSYGMKLAGTCRKHMLSKFLDQADAEISGIVGRKDFLNFKVYLVSESSLGQALSPILKQGDVVLPSDFAEVVPQFNQNVEKFFSKDAQLGSFKRFCTKFLEPFYRPMMLPLAELSRAGFDHRDINSRVDTTWTNFISNDNLKFNSKFWSIALFACEQMKLVEVDESAEQSGKEAPNNGRYAEINLPDYVVDEEVDKVISFGDLSLKWDSMTYKGKRDKLERLEDKIRESSLEVYRQMSQKGMHLDYILGGIKSMVFAGRRKKDFEKARDDLVKLAEDSRKDSRLHDGMLFFSTLGHFYLQIPVFLIGFTALAIDTCRSSMSSTTSKFLQRF